MIVAVEGLDGAGKSTVARLLAPAIGATYVALPPPELRLASTVLFEDLDSEARYAYYISGVLAIAELGRRTPLLVADRYVASAHAMHLEIDTPLADALRRLPLREPDLTIYLEVEEQARSSRLQRRGRELDPFEERLNADGGFRHRVDRRMRASRHTRCVDTTGRTPEAVAHAAQRVWEEVSHPHGG